MASKSEETRSLILARAAEAFAEEGFDQVSMRALAASCDLSLGAFYYYFRSKDEIILEFYRESMKDFARQAEQGLRNSRSLRGRIEVLFQARLDTMKPQRDLYKVLARSAVDPNSPLSPFSKESRDIREEAIRLVQLAISPALNGSSAQRNRDISELVWGCLMGIILAWTFDSSRGQKQSDELVRKTASLLARGLQALNTPVVGRFFERPVREILGLVRS